MILVIVTMYWIQCQSIHFPTLPNWNRYVSINISEIGHELQWNPVNTDTNGTGQIVRINGVSVLSGVSEKSHEYMFYRHKEEGKRFYGNKTLFNCTVTVTNANCELSD